MGFNEIHVWIYIKGFDEVEKDLTDSMINLTDVIPSFPVDIRHPPELPRWMKGMKSHVWDHLRGNLSLI